MLCVQRVRAPRRTASKFFLFRVFSRRVQKADSGKVSGPMLFSFRRYRLRTSKGSKCRCYPTKYSCLSCLGEESNSRFSGNSGKVKRLAADLTKGILGYSRRAFFPGSVSLGRKNCTYSPKISICDTNTTSPLAKPVLRDNEGALQST